MNANVRRENKANTKSILMYGEILLYMQIYRNTKNNEKERLLPCQTNKSEQTKLYQI